MRYLLFLLLLLAVASTMGDSGQRVTKLAVMEIEDLSGTLDKKILENAAEALRGELVASNKFVVISKDRQQKQAVKEMKKESWKECYDQSCRIQLGQALTADTILTGKITLFGKAYTLMVELIDLAKEATIKGAKVDFDGTENGLADAVRNVAVEITGVGTIRKKVDTEGDAQACAMAKQKDTHAMWSVYLEEFPKGACAFEAKSRVKELAATMKAAPAAQTAEPEKKAEAKPSNMVANRYKLYPEMVLDTKHKLLWQRRRSNMPMTHDNAAKYCQDLYIGDYGNWRLPTIGELKTIIHGCQSGSDACQVHDGCLSGKCYSAKCYCWQGAGPGEDGYFWQKGVWQGGTTFWSASVLQGSSSATHAWFADFATGKISNIGRYNKYDVRCVKKVK